MITIGSVVREILVVGGAMRISVLLGLAPKNDNVFYSHPQFALFWLVSIFHFAHSGYATILPVSARMQDIATLLLNAGEEKPLQGLI